VFDIAAIWVYLFVAATAVVTAADRSVESPDSIKTMAAAFAGYVLVVLAAVLGVDKSNA
jgi:hypothetical protein